MHCVGYMMNRNHVSMPAESYCGNMDDAIGVARKKRDVNEIADNENDDEDPSESESSSFESGVSNGKHECTDPSELPDNLSVLQSAASLLALGTSLPPPSGSTEHKKPKLDSESNTTAQATGEGRPSRKKSGKLAASKIVGDPLPMDVLCGRGRGFFNHPGNRRMLEIVEKNKARYRAAGKTRKTEIVREVTEEIQAGGTRFLKRKVLMWQEVNATEAHKKVCHCLREEKGIAENGADDFYVKGESDDARRVSMGSVELQIAMGEPEDDDDSEQNAPTPRRLKSASDKAPRKRRKKNADPDSLPVDSRLFQASDEEKSQQESEERSSQPKDSAHELDILGSAAAMQASVRDTHTSDMLRASGYSNSPHIVGDLACASALQMSSSNGHSEEARRTQLGAVPQDFHEKFGIVLGEPRGIDVLFGVDPSFHIHPGNRSLRDLIQCNVAYPPSPLEKKLIIATRIINDLRGAGSRFLTRQRNGPLGVWYRIDDLEARALIVRCLDEEEASLQSIIAQRAGVAGVQDPVSGRNPAPMLTTSNMNMAVPEVVHERAKGRKEQNTLDLAEGKKLHPPSDEGKQADDKAAAQEIKKSSQESLGEEDDDSVSDSSSASEPGFESSLGNDLQPGPYDVICGRGRGNFRHPGNRRMLRMFHNNKARYRAGTKLQKTSIGKEILFDIKRNGGRFLKRAEDGSWKEVGDRVALRKVCHGIRDIPEDPQKRMNSIIHLSNLEKSANLDKMDFSGIPKKALKARVQDSPETLPSPPPDPKQEEKQEAPPVEYPTAHKASQGEQERPTIEEPREMDVLCGRGRGHFGHPGNRRMLDIIHQNKTRYKAGSKLEKGQVAREILAEVQSNGARFLKRSEDNTTVWELCDYSEALNKVCHGIRDSLCNADTKRKSSESDAKSPAFAPSQAPNHGEDALPPIAVAEVAERNRLLGLAMEEEAARNAFMMTAHPQELLAAGNSLHPGVDAFVLNAMQRRAAHEAAAGMPMQMLMAQHAAGIANLTPEEAMLLRERSQQGRSCVIS